jgi:hypothetical protein
MRVEAVLLQACFVFFGLCSAVRAADPDKGRGPQKEAPPGPEMGVVAKWRGTWDVKSTRRHPQPTQEVIYVETFDWILDGRYLRSETSRKNDGGKSMSIFWFDMFTKSYRWVIFDASGLAVELPPPKWNESDQTMEWKGGILAPTSYTGYATFKDPNTIQWKSLLKDWRGTVILEVEGTSTRRK